MRSAKLLTALSFVVAKWMAATVQADTIPITNPSFELPVVGVGGTVAVPAAPDANGWFGLGTNANVYASQAFIDNAFGFHYTGVTGGQVGLMWDNDTILVTNLATKVEAGKSYTLTVDIGRYADSVATGDGNTALLVYPDYFDGISNYGNLVPYYTVTHANMSATGLQTFSWSTGPIAANNPGVGQYLAMAFAVYSPTTSDGVVIDNVHLSSVPEPSTLILLASGLIGLLAYAGRKR